MRVIGCMVKKVALVYWSLLMGTSIKGNSTRIILRERESIFIKMVISLKEIGKMERKMDQENSMEKMAGE